MKRRLLLSAVVRQSAPILTSVSVVQQKSLIATLQLLTASAFLSPSFLTSRMLYGFHLAQPPCLVSLARSSGSSPQPPVIWCSHCTPPSKCRCSSVSVIMITLRAAGRRLGASQPARAPLRACFHSGLRGSCSCSLWSLAELLTVSRYSELDLLFARLPSQMRIFAPPRVVAFDFNQRVFSASFILLPRIFFFFEALISFQSEPSPEI